MSQDKHSWQTALVLGVEVSVAVVAGKFIGEWIDNTYETKPWGMVSAIMIFSTAVMVSILKKLKKDFDDEN